MDPNEQVPGIGGHPQTRAEMTQELDRLALQFSPRWHSHVRAKVADAVVREWRFLAASFAALLVFLYFVWPTPFIYHADSKETTRVNRFTGVKECASESGWGACSSHVDFHLSD